jgi:Spy/CpxP family protein refolding chaperone
LFAAGVVFAAETPQKQAEERTIFTYKQELKLTVKQEKDLKSMLSSFQDFMNTKRREITDLSAELGKLVQAKKDLKAIRETINKIAMARADATYKDIETAIKVEATLTPEQLNKWKAIQLDIQKASHPQKQQAQTK